MQVATGYFSFLLAFCPSTQHYLCVPAMTQDEAAALFFKAYELALVLAEERDFTEEACAFPAEVYAGLMREPPRSSRGRAKWAKSTRSEIGDALGILREYEISQRSARKLAQHDLLATDQLVD